jgi:hypothetical protein
VSRRGILIAAACCGLAACGGGSSGPSPADPGQRVKLRPLTSDEAAPRVKRGPLARVAPALEQICADNARKVAEARRRGADPDLIAKAAAERLAGLVTAVPRPTDADARYTGWVDALRTTANLQRLAVDADGDKAKALREQAGRTAAAARATAAKLGLADCARTGAFGVPD